MACASHPECDYIRSEVFPNENEEETLLENKVLGKDNDIEILLKKVHMDPMYN